MSTLLLIVAASLLLYIAKLASPMVTYFLRKGEYAHIPKYNKKKSKAFMPSMLMSEDDGWYKMVETLRGEDGKILPVVHWGPYLDFSHTIAVADADAIREVLVNDSTFIKHPKIYDPLMRVVGDGIITAMDENWKLQRKLLTPVFHFSTLKAMIPDMNDEGQKMIQEIQKRTAKSKNGQIGVIALFSEVTLSVIIRIAFGNGFEFGYMKDQWNHIFHGLVKSMLFFSLLGSWYKHVPFKSIRDFEQAKDNIRVKCLEVIRHKRELGDINGTDLLSLMLRAEKDMPDVISEDMIVNECVSFLMAGQDTTASSLTWTTYYLARNKVAQKKLQQEVDTVLQKGNAITESDIPKLKYTKQVLDEVLRLNPASPTLARLCTKDRMCPEEELCGYHIPAGTSVVAMLVGVTQDDKHWTDPKAFNPDRFSDEAKQTTHHHPFATVPFSAGNRNCIGQKFATQEYIILLATLAQHYEFVVDEDAKFTVRFELGPVPVGLTARFIERKKNM